MRATDRMSTARNYRVQRPRLTITPVMPHSQQYRRSRRQVTAAGSPPPADLTALTPVMAGPPGRANTFGRRHGGGTAARFSLWPRADADDAVREGAASYLGMASAVAYTQS